MAFAADPAPPPESPASREARLAKEASRLVAWRPFADAINQIAEHTTLHDLNGVSAAQPMPRCEREGVYPWYRLTFGGSNNPHVEQTPRQQRRHRRMVRNLFKPSLGELLGGRDSVSLDAKMAFARGPMAFGSDVTELRVVPGDDGTVSTIILRGSYSSKGPTFPPDFTELAPTVRGVCRTPAELTRWLTGQLKQLQAPQREGHGL